jgi:hypothetical protein
MGREWTAHVEALEAQLEILLDRGGPRAAIRAALSDAAAWFVMRILIRRKGVTFPWWMG